MYPDVSSSPFGSTTPPPPDNVYGYPMNFDPNTIPSLTISARQLRISDRYFSAFLVQAMISIALRSDTSLPLQAPSLPYVNPAASFSYEEFFEPQLGTIPTLLLPQARPWLRNKLAGTPLAELLASTNMDGEASNGRRSRRQWGGYYVYGNHETGQDPPMSLELYSVQGPIASLNQEPDSAEYMHLRGEGHDGAGAFTLRGTCNTSTGVVMATKAYVGGGWEWEWWGMVTPFGMAGKWGVVEPDTGWWWIWPREWSNNPATTGSN